MNKLAAVLMIFSFWACDSKLSDEQRRQMREQMELHKIRKISEPEIIEAAFAAGRQTIKTIEKLQSDSAKLDSFLLSKKGSIHWVVPGQSNINEMEQQLIDAYLAQASGTPQDNVQKIRKDTGETDSLLYTYPVITKTAGGIETFDGVWYVRLSKKDIILSMRE